MAYSINLSNNEIGTLEWLAQRGYFPDEILRGMHLADGQEEPEDWDLDSERTYTMPEHVAWSLIDLRENDSDAYLACLSGELLEKVLKLEMSIV